MGGWTGKVKKEAVPTVNLQLQSSSRTKHGVHC